MVKLHNKINLNTPISNQPASTRPCSDRTSIEKHGQSPYKSFHHNSP